MFERSFSFQPPRLAYTLAVAGLFFFALAAGETRGDDDAREPKKIVLVAGKPSHPPGSHEFNAGVLLLKKCLSGVKNVTVETHLNGWPADPDTAFAGADTIMLFMDGSVNHELLREGRMADFDRLMDQGVGLVMVHYAVDIPPDNGGQEFLDWMGGYYEKFYSTNPHWTAAIAELPEHPITRGVRPDSILDEWYFNMRFRPENAGVVAILKATPPDEARTRTEAAKQNLGREEILAWATERDDGGRAFACTGGHFHSNWGNENFRKLVLNALLWTAKLDVPAEGVETRVTEDDLRQNLDDKSNMPAKRRAKAAKPA